jgi:hypothetical protein
MAAADSKCARRFDRSCDAEPDGQSNFIQLVPWLVSVATVIIVLRPIRVRRDESGSVHPDITVALWLSQLRGFFWWDCMAATSAPGLVSVYYFWTLYGKAIMKGGE